MIINADFPIEFLSFRGYIPHGFSVQTGLVGSVGIVVEALVQDANSEMREAGVGHPMFAM